jgi:hypothetical protein
MLELLEKPKEKNTDDSNHLAHWADAAEVTEGYIMGTPVIALCGKVFIPSRDPEKLRVCPVCKEIVDALFLGNQ